MERVQFSQNLKSMAIPPQTKALQRRCLRRFIMAAETIAGIVEYAELNDSECLAKRLEVLRHPTSARLGPPDLCYIKKRKIGSGAFSSLFYDETVGYFHWRLGLAMDKGALSIIQYMRGLVDEQEELDWSSWVVPTAQFKICYFHYCTYNPFRSIDVHIESRKLRDDGEEEDMIFDMYAVDKNGRRSPVDRDDVGLWKELRIVGVLRYMARQLSLDTFDPKITPLHLNDDCLTCFASREFLPLPNDIQPPADAIHQPPSRSTSRLNLSVENLRATQPAESAPISLLGPLSAEEAFLEFLVPFLNEGQALGSYVRGAGATVVNNLMVQIPFKYLLRQGCSNVLIDWCVRMSIDMPDFLSLEAKARRKTPHSQNRAAPPPSPQNPDGTPSEDAPPAQNDLPPEDDYANCVNALLQSIVDHPDSLDNLIELSITLLDRGERAKAIEYALLATQQYPDDSRALYCAAKIAALTNQPELALNYLLAVPVRQPPPCKDFVGFAFHRYATEPHYEYPNADQCRRIEEVDLVAVEENEADLSLARANLNKIERIFYRIFHIIIKISGREVLAGMIRQRGPHIKEAQEKARIEHKKALEKEIENRPPPRSKRTRMRPLSISTTSSSSAASSTTSSSPSIEESSSSSSLSSSQDKSTIAKDHDSNKSEHRTANEEKLGDDLPAESHDEPVQDDGSGESQLPSISKSKMTVETKVQVAEAIQAPSPAVLEDNPDFFVIDMDKPLPPPLSYQLDVTFDTVRHAYLSLLEDLKTVEKWTTLTSMSVAALVRLGLIHKRLGSHESALEAFETALTLGWSFRGCRELFFLHVQAGKARQALECADRNLRHLTHRWSTSYPDWQLRAGLWRIVSRKSLKHVLHILENLQDVNDWHPFLRRCLEDAPFHQVDNTAM